MKINGKIIDCTLCVCFLEYYFQLYVPLMAKTILVLLIYLLSTSLLIGENHKILFEFDVQVCFQLNFICFSFPHINKFNHWPHSKKIPKLKHYKA